MTESAPFTQIQDLSAALATLVASTAPSVISVQSHRSRSSGFVWRPGFIVTADEALSEDGEFAVTLSGGDTVPAQLVGRDPSTDVALLRIDRSDLRPIPLEARIELDLRFRRSAEGGLAVDPAGRAIGMTVFGPRPPARGT
jgi:S1-C subfamily serine protease